MPKVIRVGRDFTQGHCWPPMFATIGSVKTFIKGIPIVRAGDTYGPHPGPCGIIPPHPPSTAISDSTVFIEGRPVHRDGDPITCGDAANNGSNNVFADGGGRGGPGAGGDKRKTTGYTVRLPNIEYRDSIMFYQVTRQTQKFVRGCPIVIEPFNIHTPLVEEGSESLFKNFPGPPMTEQKGASLPKYAPKSYSNPIPITLSVQGLPAGFTFNSTTGVITGALPLETVVVYEVTVTAENFVGRKSVKFKMSPRRAIKCP